MKVAGSLSALGALAIVALNFAALIAVTPNSPHRAPDWKTAAICVWASLGIFVFFGAFWIAIAEVASNDA